MTLRRHNCTRICNRAHRTQALPSELALQDTTPTRSRSTCPARRPSDPSLHHGRDQVDSFTSSGLTNGWDHPLHTCSDNGRHCRNYDENNKFYTNSIIFESYGYFKKRVCILLYHDLTFAFIYVHDPNWSNLYPGLNPGQALMLRKSSNLCYCNQSQ